MVTVGLRARYREAGLPHKGHSQPELPLAFKNPFFYSCLKAQTSRQKPKGILEHGSWILCPW